MHLALTARIELDPNDDPSWGVVTWFDAEVMDLLDDESERKVGQASAALIHAGDAGENLLFALASDSAELEAMYDAFFDVKGGLREQFMQGAGTCVLYVASIEIEEAWKGRNLDLAVVRRLADAFGDGCELVVVPYESRSEVDHWQHMGFQVSTPGKEPGYLHLPMAFRQARVAPIGDGFKVLPNPSNPEKSH